MRTITIELRVDFQEEEKYDIILEAVREGARTMLGTAVLLKDKRDPQISVQHGDMFERNKELEVFKPEDLGE